MLHVDENDVRRAEVLGNTVRYLDSFGKKSYAKRDTAILFLAGQRSPLERFSGIHDYFAQYYRTYTYEFPGLGLQQRNPETPISICQFAKELISFVEQKVEEKNIIVVASSAGFWFFSEALQLSEKLRARVTKIVSFVGLLGKDTFGFSQLRKSLYISACRLFTSAFGRTIIRTGLKSKNIQQFFIRRAERIHGVSINSPDYQEQHAFEEFLLQCTDWNIHYGTVLQYLTTPQTSEIKIDIPVLALTAQHDQYFPLENQKRAFQLVYKNVIWERIEMVRHAPVLAKRYDELLTAFPEEKVLSFLEVSP